MSFFHLLTELYAMSGPLAYNLNTFFGGFSLSLETRFIHILEASAGKLLLVSESCLIISGMSLRSKG